MRKIGPHGILRSDAAERWAQHANIVKSASGHGEKQAIVAAPVGAITIYRHIFSETEQTEIMNRCDARTLCDFILSDLGGFACLYVELLNEIPGVLAERYIELASKAVPILHAAGLRVAGPSWATGDYEKEHWEAWRAAGWCGMDAIALHAYFSTAGFTSWNALRWKSYWQQGDPLVLITECGRDRVKDGDSRRDEGWLPQRDGDAFGWSAPSQNCSAEEFITEVELYDVALSVDPAVLGAVLFTVGATSDWREKGFDCDGLVDRLIEGWEPVDLVGTVLAPTTSWRADPITTSVTWPTPATTAVWSPDPLPDDRRGDPVTEALNFLWDQTLHKPEAEAVEMQKHIIALKRGLGLE